MNGLPLLLALEGTAHEHALLAGLNRPGSGVTVVRRCVDLADLLAAASSRTASTAVVAAELRRLDHEAVSTLRSHGVSVVAVVAAGDESSERRMRMLGAVDVVAVGAEDPGPGVEALLATLRDGPHAPAVLDLREPAVPEGPSGHVVAVWGPTGAPGRTTVATYLACEVAAMGVTTFLADADTYGGSVAQLLGLLDESPGLAAAARAVSGGALDSAALARVAREVGPNLRVLTGIVRADRWPELRQSALAEVWARARTLAQLTVVDCGFCLEQDEELSYDTRAPRRNGATLSALEAADVLVAVGRADPVGVQRLVRSLPEARTAAVSARLHVVLTRVRRGPVGRDAEAQLLATLSRHAGVDRAVLVREDQEAYDEALSSGRALHEVAPRSPARAALLGLARELVGPPATRPGRRRRVRQGVGS